MSDSEKLDRIEQRLERIEAAIGRVADTTPRVTPAYELPPLPVDQVTVSERGARVWNRDGSLWVRDINGVPQRDYFGYYSAEKCPETHEKLGQMFGASYAQWYEARDPWSIYKVDIRDMVQTGVINWITFSWLMQPATRMVQ